jgi:hypothetical protein
VELYMFNSRINKLGYSEDILKGFYQFWYWNNINSLIYDIAGDGDGSLHDIMFKKDIDPPPTVLNKFTSVLNSVPAI